MSSLSLIPEEKKFLPTASKSTESLYSSSSSKYSATAALYKKKLTSMRQPAFIPSHSEVRQRVLSARRLRMKTLQNQLADAQQHIAELANENRILRTLHKRQDTALSKYEGTNAELPQLLHSHAEEVRMWQAKYRNLHSQNRDLARKLKDRESMILALGDQNKHLGQLNKSKNLEERERLTERVKYLENRLNDKDNDLKLLNRRLQLEEKNYKTQLQNERIKYKRLIQKLDDTKFDAEKLAQVQLDTKERPSRSMMPRSLSGSKLPKFTIKDCSEGDRTKKDDPHCSNSTPSIGLEPILNGELKTCKSAGSMKMEYSKLTNGIQKKFGQSSRESSGVGQRTKKHQTNDFPTELTDAITKGMSKLLRTEEEDNEKISPRDDDDQEENGDRSNRNYLRPNYEEDYIDDVDSLADENETADVIIGGKIVEDSEDDEDDVLYETQLEFANIQKQMSDDYRQRETYLDTFCRQTTVIEKESSTRRSMNIDAKKKDELLAALKAIDTERG